MLPYCTVAETVLRVARDRSHVSPSVRSGLDPLALLFPVVWPREKFPYYSESQLTELKNGENSNMCPYGCCTD